MLNGYYRHPTIHQDTIVFVSEDDLWSLPAAGGPAHRLTANLGEVSWPRFSPDGAQLAFVGREEGHPEVYVMPAPGGPARRLTFLGGGLCLVLGWTADGKIIFANNAAHWYLRFTHLYTVDPVSGAVEQLNYGLARSIAFGPDGGVVLGRNTDDPARWKRYRGGTAGRLWIDRQGSGQFQPFLAQLGNLTSPMWLAEPAGGPGRIYFISDHEGFGNLYSCTPDGADLRRHTHHTDFYARNASTDGRRIVYHAGADLYLYDPQSERSSLAPVAYHSPRVQRNRKFVSAARYLESHRLHPKGEMLALITRGKLFSLANWEGPVARHEAQASEAAPHPALTGVRHRLPAWLPDGKYLLAVTDVGGEESFVIFDATDATAAPQILPALDMGRPVALAVSPRRNQVVFSNNRQELLFLDLETGDLRLVDRGVAERIAGFAWSPDGEWVAYSVSISNQVSVIKLWNLLSGESTQITRPVLRDVAPAFDPQGRFLYFLSYRTFNPVYDALHFELSFPRGVKPYLVTLQKDLPSPFIPRPRLESTPPEKKAPPPKSAAPEEAAPGEAGSAQGAEKSEAEKKEARLQIDLEGIQERIIAFPVAEGIYGQVAGAADGKVLYTRYPVEGALDHSPNQIEPEANGSLYVYTFEDQREEYLMGGITRFSVNIDGRHMLARSGNQLRVLKAGEKPPSENHGPNRKSGWIDLDRLKVAIEPGAEWRQMYREAWRLQRDQFWTEDMSQIDWLAVHDRYLPLVDRVGSRSEFSDLMWEMQGELGTSHAYEFGGDYRPEPRYSQGYLGAHFTYDAEAQGWRVAQIYQGDVWDAACDSPLHQPGINIQTGDLLTAVNGQRLDEQTSPAMTLVNLADEEVALTIIPAKTPQTGSPAEPPGETGPAAEPPAVGIEPTGEPPSSVETPAGEDREAAAGTGDNADTSAKQAPAARTVTVHTLRSEQALRYRAWVEANRSQVHTASGGRLGYLHIPDMQAPGFAEFHRGFLAESTRDGLVVDLRFNRGGSVSALLLEKLARRRIGYDVSRWSQEPFPFPHYSIAGPLVAIANEYAGSDGDIFSHSFKLFKLGPLVGTRTWGGVIGIWPRHSLVDGTVTTQPEFSSWFYDVGWNVENYGVDPDIEVDITPQDYAAGVDAQLERAIEEAMRLLEANPPQAPDFSQRPNLAAPRLPVSE